MPQPPYIKCTGRVVTVYDIKDLEAFVRSCVPKTKLKLERDEREELVQEGMVIALDLASKFKPQMDGYEREGSFAGYCSMFLPKKMWAAWHRWHPEHIQEMQKQPDGSMKKRYVYGEAPASLEKYIQPDNADNTESMRGMDSDRIRTVGDFVK